MDDRTQPARFYDPVMRGVHWATLTLIMATYGLIWFAHSGLAGGASAAFVQLHRSCGLTVAALTIFRLVWRWRANIPALPADLPLLQKIAARITETVIYLLLLAQPLLGWLYTNFRGQRIDLFLLGAIPPAFAADKTLAHLTHELHELAGNVLLVVIGLHAAAALFHHVVRRDGVLLTMLPTRLHRASEYLRSPTRRGILRV